MSDMTLGQEIGVVRHTFKISQYKGGPSMQLSIGVDFSTSSDDDIKGWLTSNRVIAGQRPWRDMNKEELKGLDGKTFVAQNIGQKIKTRKEQLQALTNAGLPMKLAEFALDNPEQFNKVVQGIEVEGEEQVIYND